MAVRPMRSAVGCRPSRNRRRIRRQRGRARHRTSYGVAPLRVVARGRRRAAAGTPSIDDQSPISVGRLPCARERHRHTRIAGQNLGARHTASAPLRLRSIDSTRLRIALPPDLTQAPGPMRVKKPSALEDNHPDVGPDRTRRRRSDSCRCAAPPGGSPSRPIESEHDQRISRGNGDVLVAVDLVADRVRPDLAPGLESPHGRARLGVEREEHPFHRA